MVAPVKHVKRKMLKALRLKVNTENVWFNPDSHNYTSSNIDA